MSVRLLALTAVVLLAEPRDAAAAAKARTRPASELAQAIVHATGVRVGLCVHLGVTDGELDAALGRSGNFVVHGVAADDESMARARRHIQSQGLYGRVSVERGSFDRLPYADNLVNLLVAGDLPGLLSQGLSAAEAMRVLCPQGWGYVGSSAERPPIGAGEASWVEGFRADLVAAGAERVEVVRHAGTWVTFTKPRPMNTDEWPQWRHDASRTSVSRDQIVDVPRQLQWIDGPQRSRHHTQHPLGVASAGGRLFYVYDMAPRFVLAPPELCLVARDAYNGLPLWQRPISPGGSRVRETAFNGRTLVTVGNRVYAPLRCGGPLAALDAATGAVLETYAGAPLEEVLAFGGDLLLVEGDRLRLIDPLTGRTRWQRDGLARGMRALVGGDSVFVQVPPDTLLRLDLATGSERWRRRDEAFSATILCAYDSGRLALTGEWVGVLMLVSAADGSPLWTHTYPVPGHGGSPTNVFFVDGLVWLRDAGTKDGRPEAWLGLDPATGEARRRHQVSLTQKCCPDKATERHLLCGMMDFVHVKTGICTAGRGARVVCGFGALPANGLVTTFPTDCVCHPMVRGTMALAPGPEAFPRGTGFQPVEHGQDGGATTGGGGTGFQPVIHGQDGRATVPLQRGAAFGTAPSGESRAADWPCYRHDAQRSGSTPSAVTADLKRLWETRLPAPVTSPVAARGRVFLASTDAHEMHSLEAATGRHLWTYTAGGRIDLPPTVFAGLCLFGCRDGCVYALRAEDGQLAWRFRAAPGERRIMAYGQVESTWPVPGSPLVDEGVAYVAAGRSNELDGGIVVYALDPLSGEVLWRTRPTSNTIADLLLRSGDHLFMWRSKFDPKTGEHLRTSSSRDRFLWAPNGFTDETRASRTAWSDARTSGHLLVFDARRTFATLSFPDLTKGAYLTPGKGENRVFLKMSGEPLAKEPAGGNGEWSVPVPVRVTAMLLAADVLFVAGPPEAVHPAIQPSTNRDDIVNILAAWPDLVSPKRGELLAMSAADGTMLGRWPLAAAPVFDGLAAADGRLYLAAKDGTVKCFGK